jgi:hypothetical protein
MNGIISISRDENAVQKNKFFEEGFKSYLDVISAIHLFQTEVAKETKDVIEGQRIRIKTAMELETEMPEASRRIWPDFPDDKWNYEGADISSTVWLNKPQFCTLHLGVGFSKHPPMLSLYCAAEVKQKYLRDNWLKIFKNQQAHPYFDEEWDGYAVGLRRQFESSNDLNQGLTAILEGFLSCIENAK